MEYQASLRRLTILLTEPGVPDDHRGSERAEMALLIVAGGCRRFSGPFSWIDSDLSVVERGTTDELGGSFVVWDPTVGFELACASVYLFSGSPAELAQPPGGPTASEVSCDEGGAT